MSEQAAAIGQIAQSAEDMRRLSDQTSKGLAEQARAAAEVSDATRNVARQISLIVRANREQSENAGAALETVSELRRLGDRAIEELRASGADPALATQLADHGRRASGAQESTDRR
jgi:methyl-accepting chemotaxis protein